MSLQDLLESDLRTLANEGKKKSGELKELTEKAISMLRQSEKIPISSIFQVLQSAKACNNLKVLNLAISVLQKLVTSKEIDSLTPALAFLQSVLEEYFDENLQLKVLQTLMLIQSPQIVKISADLIGIIWQIYLSLQNSKNSLIRNTVSATLRQLVNVTFHELKSNRDQVIVEAALALIKNFCEVLRGRSLELVRLKPEAMELITEILEISKGFILEVDQVFQVVRCEMSEIIVVGLNEDCEENIAGKSLRCSWVICELSGGSEEIILHVIKLVENRKISEWLCIGCLDFMSQLVNSPPILKYVYKNIDLHIKLLDTLSKISHELFAQPEDLRQASVKTKVRIISELINHWGDSIAIIAEGSGVKLGEMNQVPTDPLPSLMVSSIWKPLLPILSIMVANSYNESILQTMLNSYQTLVNLAGTLGLSSAREALLASLCQFCIPNTSSILNPKHMHICKTLFNITHCLGFVLDSKAWHKVLDTLYKLDFLLNTSGKQEDPDLSSDVSILTSAMESLFRNTTLWPDSTIVDLMSALGQLTLEFMETLATNEKKLSGGKVFGVEKMIIVGQNNLDRIELYWDSLSAYMDCICNSKYPEIRVLGTSSISRIILSAFKKFTESPPKNLLDKWVNWQRTLLLCLHDLLGSVHSDTQESVFEVVYSILQAYGGQLDSSGWSMLLFILSKINMNSNGKAGFKCLHFVVSDFLESENLLPSLERLITCVSKYAHSDESNQAIGAVGMYWNIADYLGRLGRDEVDLWWIILEELKVLGEDYRMEVRHSALHSLHIALSTHGAVLTANAWQRVMEDIIVSLFDRISLNYFKNAENRKSPAKNSEAKAKTNLQTMFSDSNEKQWEETYNIFTQNLGKIFRTYLNNLERQDEDILEMVVVRKHWDLLVNKLKEGIRLGTANIVMAVLKTIKELLFCNRVTLLFFSKWASSWELVTTLAERLGNEDFSVNFKLISTILDVLYSVLSTQFDEPFEDLCLLDTYSIVNSLLKSTSNESPLTCAKLLPEQREVWEFVENLMKNLHKHGKNFSTFISFLLKFLKYQADYLHSDSFCRKALEITENLLLTYPGQISSQVHEILDHYQKLLLLRFSNETFQQTLISSKTALPLWYIAGESLLKVLPALCDPLYICKTITIFQSVLNVSEKTISKLSKSNLELISKSGEELDIKMIENLTNLLIGEAISDQDLKLQFINIIDNGCDSFYKGIYVQELILRKSFTNVCFASLLKLSQEQSKSASICVSVLVNRCKDLLVKFSKEEKLSGMMPLPKVKLLEMLEVLKELKKLEVVTGSLGKPGKKAHLLEIFPQLCELITVKDSEIKEVLKQVFLEISKTM